MNGRGNNFAASANGTFRRFLRVFFRLNIIGNKRFERYSDIISIFFLILFFLKGC